MRRTVVLGIPLGLGAPPDNDPAEMEKKAAQLRQDAENLRRRAAEKMRNARQLRMGAEKYPENAESYLKAAGEAEREADIDLMFAAKFDEQATKLQIDASKLRAIDDVRRSGWFASNEDGSTPRERITAEQSERAHIRRIMDLREEFNGVLLAIRDEEFKGPKADDGHILELKQRGMDILHEIEELSPPPDEPSYSEWPELRSPGFATSFTRPRASFAQPSFFNFRQSAAQPMVKFHAVSASIPSTPMARQPLRISVPQTTLPAPVRIREDRGES